MATIDDNSKTLGISSIRQARHYMRFLNLQLPPVETLESISSILAHHLKAQYPDPQNLKQALAQLKAQVDAEQLPEIEFEWLTKSELACLATWGWLAATQASQHVGSMWGIPLPQQAVKEAATLQNALDRIIRYFDLNISTPGDKRAYLEFLHNNWLVIRTQEDMLKWVDQKDVEQLKWLQERLNTHQIATPIPFAPEKTKEHYLALASSFLISPASAEKKELELIKIKKAWSQKKFRAKQQGKATLNTHIKKEAKERLGVLAAHYKINMTEMLERLINEEYELIKD